MQHSNLYQYYHSRFRYLKLDIRETHFQCVKCTTNINLLRLVYLPSILCLEFFFFFFYYIIVVMIRLYKYEKFNEVIS